MAHNTIITLSSATKARKTRAEINTRQLRYYITATTAGLLSVFLTVFAGLNAAEVYINRDLPLANALQPIRHQEVLNNIIQDFQRSGSKELRTQDQQFKAPENIFWGPRKEKFLVSQERKIGDAFYIFISKCHYSILNTDVNNNPGDILIYCRKGWRTVAYPENLIVGTAINVEAVNATVTTYIVRENVGLDIENRYVATASTARQILFYFEDEVTNNYIIVRAESVV